MTLRNQYVEDRRPFFLRSHQNPGKIVAFFREDLYFFGDHMKIRTKLLHFPRLFWSSLNRRCVIFEQAPGPRLALGAPARLFLQLSRTISFALISTNTFSDRRH